MRRTAVVVAALALAHAGFVGLAPTASAEAHTTVSLPLTAFRDIVVDEAHGHVFVTGGPADGIVVRTLEGAAVTTISGVSGAAQMVLASGGSRLLVALEGADAIAAIDTSTLTEVARYATGASTCPSTLALVGAKVWFGYGCAAGSGNLGVLDTVAPSVSLQKLASGTFGGAPALQGVPAFAGVLVAAARGATPGLLQVFNVSSGDAVLGNSTNPGDDLRDLTVSGDGRQAITVTGPPLLWSKGWEVPTLSPGASYAVGEDIMALAAGPQLTAVGRDSSTEQDLYLYRSGDTSSPIGMSEIGTNGAGVGLNRGGLAITATGDRVFAVIGSPGDFRLEVIFAAAQPASAIQLGFTRGALINKIFGVAGSLYSGRLPLTGPHVLTVVRESPYGTVIRPSITTAANGSFTLTDTVAQRGIYGYQVTWAGDATHAGTTSHRTVYVKGLIPALSIPMSGPYEYGERRVVGGNLGPTHVRKLAIYATPRPGVTTLLKEGTVDTKGRLTVPFWMVHNTAVSVSFPGDDVYETRTVTKDFHVKAKVIAAMTGGYATVDGRPRYHVGQPVTVRATVLPRSSGGVDFYIVYYVGGGRWGPLATPRQWLVDSQTVERFTTDLPAGTLFRVRARYPANLTTLLNDTGFSPWQYGVFTT